MYICMYIYIYMYVYIKQIAPARRGRGHFPD